MFRSKKKKIKINLSCTALIKSRCKYCKSVPMYYYYMMKQISFPDVNDANEIQSWLREQIKNMSTVFFPMESPRNFLTLRSFSQKTSYKKYDPRIHKNYGYDATQSNVVDRITCSCGQTSWAFNQTNARTNPSIKQRKLKVGYNTQIIY